MSELPSGWEWARVRDVVVFGPKNDAPDESEAGFVPLHHMGIRYRARHTFETRRWSDIKRGYTHFADGDVLLARITPSFENGKAGIVRGLPQGIGAGSSEYFVCRPMAGVLLPEYLLAHFKSPQFLRDGKQVMSGAVGQQRVPKSFVLDSLLPLPPFQEQKRLTQKLDGLLERVDASRDKLDRVLETMRVFRMSVLAAATSARLTHDWRVTPEAEWGTATIGDIAAVGTGATPSRANPEYYAAQGIPWITSSATGSEFVTSAREFVTEAAMQSGRLRVYPPGTLIVAMYGEGKTRGQVSELTIPATINQACASVVVDEAKARRRYVKLALQANYLAMRDLAEGGNQPNLNVGKIRRFELPLPPLAEQDEIVRRAEALLLHSERIESVVGSVHPLVSRLNDSILAGAFRGALVPQDPRDEPASVILERARATNNAIPAVRRSVAARGFVRAPKEDASMTKSRFDDDVRGKPYLASMLRASSNALTAEELFRQSDLPIVDFYKQLAWEVAQGLILDDATKLEAA